MVNCLRVKRMSSPWNVMMIQSASTHVVRRFIIHINLNLIQRKDCGSCKNNLDNKWGVASCEHRCKFNNRSRSRITNPGYIITSVHVCPSPGSLSIMFCRSCQHISCHGVIVDWTNQLQTVSLSMMLTNWQRDTYRWFEGKHTRANQSINQSMQI